MLASIVRKVSVNSSWEVCGQHIRSTLPWGMLSSGAPAHAPWPDPCLPSPQPHLLPQLASPLPALPISALAAGPGHAAHCGPQRRVC